MGKICSASESWIGLPPHTRQPQETQPPSGSANWPHIRCFAHDSQSNCFAFAGVCLRGEPAAATSRNHRAKHPQTPSTHKRQAPPTHAHATTTHEQMQALGQRTHLPKPRLASACTTKAAPCLLELLSITTAWKNTFCSTMFDKNSHTQSNSVHRQCQQTNARPDQSSNWQSWHIHSHSAIRSEKFVLFSCIIFCTCRSNLHSCKREVLRWPG